MKNVIRTIFSMIGFGTLIFIPMLIADNGFNETLQSVVTWIIASGLYGLSAGILKMKSHIKYPVHVLICFLITIVTRFFYSLINNGSVAIAKTILTTIPIFIGAYVLVYLFIVFVNKE